MSDERHRRPPGADDATVEAVGKVSEALEWVERARGRLYDFHQMMGHADHAERLRDRMVGRNVLDGRWTFQIVEEFDDLYWTAAREEERRVRDDLMGGRRHVFESEMKDDRITPGEPGHERRPADAHDPTVTALDDD